MPLACKNHAALEKRQEISQAPLTGIPGILIIEFCSQGQIYLDRTYMAISIGTKAPDFSLSSKSADGLKLVKLSDNFGKKNTLLLFFPMAFTGVCTAELCATSAGLEAYQEVNAQVYGISGDSPFSLEAWAQKEQIKVPLLSDYDHAVTKAYDVAYDSFAPERGLPMGGVAKRSAFIIDRNGVIQYAESSDNPRQLPNFDAIKAKLDDLA